LRFENNKAIFLPAGSIGLYTTGKQGGTVATTFAELAAQDIPLLGDQVDLEALNS